MVEFKQNKLFLMGKHFMQQQNNNKTVKSERFYLYWKDESTQKQISAGVAFFQEEYGEYRLKVDVMQGAQIFLRPVKNNNGSTFYRVELAIKKNDKFSHRSAIGSGISSERTQNDVEMEIGPYTKKLVLRVNQKANE